MNPPQMNVLPYDLWDFLYSGFSVFRGSWWVREGVFPWLVSTVPFGFRHVSFVRPIVGLLFVEIIVTLVLCFESLSSFHLLLFVPESVSQTWKVPFYSIVPKMI